MNYIHTNDIHPHLNHTDLNKITYVVQTLLRMDSDLS